IGVDGGHQLREAPCGNVVSQQTRRAKQAISKGGSYERVPSAFFAKIQVLTEIESEQLGGDLALSQRKPLTHLSYCLEESLGGYGEVDFAAGRRPGMSEHWGHVPDLHRGGDRMPKRAAILERECSSQLGLGGGADHGIAAMEELPADFTEVEILAEAQVRGESSKPTSAEA